MREKPTVTAGFTPRSVAASLLAMLVSAIVVQLAGVTDEWSLNIGNEPLPVPAVIGFLAVAGLAAAAFAATRRRWLTKAEMVCVLFAVMLATPFMAEGFWRYMLSASNTITRKQAFDRYDALPPRLWPHGPNLVAGAFAPGPRPDRTISGAAEWAQADLPRARAAPVVRLANASATNETLVRIAVPVGDDDSTRIRRGQPFLVTVLARPSRLAADARYFCRIRYDDSPYAEEVFASAAKPERDFLQREGFTRLGRYGVTVPTTVARGAALEFGLIGRGTVEFADPELVNVSTLESAFTGRRIVSASQYHALPPADRAGLIVKPDSPWSAAGLRFLLDGYIPLREWIPPLAAWASLLALVLAATLALALILRRQWIESERYPLPLAQVPIALIERDDDSAVAAIWRNRWMWTGFAVVLAWCVVRGARGYNPGLPDLDVAITIKSYLAGPQWGRMWDGIVFRISGLILGLSLFMELNVLLSLVLGLLLFRAQFWLGDAYGLAKDTAYPYAEEQRIGAFAVYAVLILLFARKHLARVVRAAVRGERDPEDPLSPRAALILLAATPVGVAAWARWVGLHTPDMLGLFAFLVAFGLVAAKLRAECGTPASGFAPSAAGSLFVLPMLGGMATLGADSVVVIILALTFFTSQSFFHLPGMQVELLEVGRRFGLRPRHLLYTAALGLAGGIAVGGWVYLSSAYAIGADNYPLATGHFSGRGNWKLYTLEMTKSMEALKAAETAPAAKPAAAGERGAAGAPAQPNPLLRGMLIGGIGTAVFAFLRQFLAGFWFHPAGFILGSTGMINEAWGSLLTAWLIRYVVLKLGGAATVRQKLLPMAAGVTLGTVAAYALFIVVHLVVYFYVPGTGRTRIAF